MFLCSGCQRPTDGENPRIAKMSLHFPLPSSWFLGSMMSTAASQHCDCTLSLTDLQVSPALCLWKCLLCAGLTILWLGGVSSLANSGGSLQQLSEVMFEDGGVQILSLAPEHTAGHLSAVETHKLPPAHCRKEGRRYRFTVVEEELHYCSKSTNTTM